MSRVCRMNLRCVVVVAVMGVFAMPSLGGSWKDSDLAKSRFGPSWVGPNVTPEKLRGKIVLAETWGYRCPPCVGSMSKLLAMQKKYGRKLVIVAMHAQGTSDSVKEKVLNLCKTKKVNYIVTAGGRVPGSTGRGIPHVQLIAPSGKMVWQGHPTSPQLVKSIEALLPKVKMPEKLKREMRAEEICGDRKYVTQKKAVKLIYAGQLGASYKSLVDQHKDTEAAADEETIQLLEGLDTYAKSLFTEAEKLRAEQPAKMIRKLRTISKLFIGTPYGKQADDQVKELTKDKEFQAHLKCERAYQAIMNSTKRIGTPPENEKERSLFLKKKQSRIKLFASQAKSFIKKNPESPFATKLTEQLTLYGVTLDEPS